MNYIYDVITNFFEDYYDFFEWDKKDNFTHFKKIPIIKINNKDYNIIQTNNIKIDEELELPNLKEIIGSGVNSSIGKLTICS